MATRRFLLAAVILTAVLAAAIAALGVGGGPTPTREADGQSMAPATAAPAAAGVSAVAAENASDQHTAPPDLVRDATTNPGAEPAAGPRVRVVQGDPPVAVADAEVLFVTSTQARQRRGPDLSRRRLAWPEACGRRLLTDVEGLATLPPTTERWLVAARTPGMFAFAYVPPGDRVVTLTLRVDERLVVRVTDADGAPAPGTPVDVLQHDGRSETARVIWSGAAGDDGLAVVDHFQFARRPARDNGASERFAATLRIAAPTPVLAEFAGRPAPAEAIELVAPAMTAVDVLLTDQRDTPLLSPATVTLRAMITAPAYPIETAADESAFPVPSRSRRQRAEKPAGAEAVRINWVARGTMQHPTARFPGERGTVSGQLIEIPATAANEDAEHPTLRTKLPLTAEFAVLAGRILLDSGEPLADTRLVAVLWREGQHAGSLRITTTASGHFDVVRRPRNPDADLLEIHARVGEGDAHRRVGCRQPFAMPAAGDRLELGDLVLSDLPTLVTGIVVDDQDTPVARASVTVQRKQQQPQRPRGPFDPRRGRPGQGRGQGGEAEAWRNVPLLRAGTDAQGRFTLRGDLPAGELRVRADTDQHLQDSVPLHGNGHPLRIRIARNGIVHGRALLPDWLPNEAANLTLQPAQATGGRGNTRSIELSRRRNGHFTVAPLHAGRYDAVVRLRNLARPVMTIPDVHVAPGRTRDPRLAILDLRQSIFRYRLQAVDLGGHAMDVDSPLLMRWKNDDGSTAQAGFRWRDGRTEFYAASTFVELVSFAPGCQPQVVHLGPGDHQIAMRHLAPAQLLLPGARALCGTDRKVRVSVVLVGESGYPQWLQGRDQRSGQRLSFPRWELGKSTGAWLEQHDRVSVPIVKAGKYEVILRIHATMSTLSQQVSVKLGEFELEVDGSRSTPVEVPIDAQKVEAAIARFKPPEDR